MQTAITHSHNASNSAFGVAMIAPVAWFSGGGWRAISGSPKALTMPRHPR